MSLFESLKDRPFTLLLSGQSLSRLGDNIYRVALVWWVLEQTGSATVMSQVLILSYLPMLLFTLIGGAIVDRFSRMHVMFVADLLRFLVLTAVAILSFMRSLELWHVYAASVTFGTVEAFFQPAYAAVLPDIASRGSLISATSLTSLSKQLAQVLGPALSGAIVKMGGTTAAFAIDGASFLVSAACLFPLLKLVGNRTSSVETPNLIREIGDGLRTVIGAPWLWITIAIASLLNVTQGGPYIVSLPFLIRDRLHGDAGSLGIVYSMFAIGSVIATLAIGRLAIIKRRGILAYTALMISGLMTLTFGIVSSVTSVFLVSFILGASITLFTLVWTNTLQEMVPREFLGRVISIDSLGSYVFLPLSYAVSGLATDRLGVAVVFLIGGSVTTALAALGLINRSVRQLN